MSLPARMLNVFAVPGEVFEEVRVSPPAAANWLVPALLLIVLGWIGSWLIFSQDSIRYQITELTEKAIQTQIEKAKVPEAQAEQMRKFGSIGLKVNMALMPVFVAFITPFFWGLVLWLVGAKMMKGTFGFMKAVEVAGLANCVMLLETIVKTLLIILSGNLFAAPSLALLIKDFDPQNSLHGLLAAVNVMTLWLLIVRAIGLSRLAVISFNKAALVVFGIWAGYTTFWLGFGLAMKALFGG